MIHQNVAEENYVVSVRTVFGGRTARASTNKFDDESLRQVVRSSESLARVQHPDPDLLPMPDSSEAIGNAGVGAGATYTMPSDIFEQTAASLPNCEPRVLSKIVGVADRHKLTTAGVFSSAEALEGIFNSRGLSSWHTQTSAEVSITMLASDSSGWQKANSPDVANLDPLSLAEIAARKAVESARPREIPAGKYTVILEPAAVLDIVGFMFWDFPGMAILDQRSFLTGRIGTKLFGDNITIWDDVAHPLQSGSPFDGEGMQRQQVQLVENGVVKRVVYARATAERMKQSEYQRQSWTDRGDRPRFPVAQRDGRDAAEYRVRSADNPQTVEQMIASTERGMLVTRLWYIREVEPSKKC